MKTIKVIKTGATAVETRKQLRKGVNKVKVESRPNVGPELLDLIEDYRHLAKSRKNLNNTEIAVRLNIFDSQVKMLKKLTGYGEENKEKKESFKRRVELQKLRQIHTE